MKLRQFLSVLAVLLLVCQASLAPVAAADGGDVISAGIQQDVGYFSFDSVSQDVVRYGASGSPSFVVTVSDGEMDSLESWASESDERVVQSASGNRALVSAPASDIIDPGILSESGLATVSYIEFIDYNVQYEVEPVSLIAEDGAESPLSTFEQYALAGGQKWTTNGVAFSGDANNTNVSDALGFIGADSVSQTGETVTVAALDSGTNHKSSLYSDRIQYGKNFFDGSTINTTDGDYAAIEDGNGHGSWVTSAIHEVAPNATLAVGKTLDDDGSGSTQTIVDGIEWACNDVNAGVVSMSLGSVAYSEAIDSAIQDCVEEHDTVFVVASGNSRLVNGVGPSSPSDSANVITVAATNPVEAENATSAYFSEVGPDSGIVDGSTGATRGAEIDIAAPGMKVGVEVSSTSGAVSTRYLSGTSMATPLVSGSVALLLEDEPGLTHDEVADRLQRTATRMPNAGSTEVGAGMVHAAHAIDNVETEDSQNSVRTDDAIARDELHTALSGTDSPVNDFLVKLAAGL